MLEMEQKINEKYFRTRKKVIAQYFRAIKNVIVQRNSNLQGKTTKANLMFGDFCRILFHSKFIQKLKFCYANEF